ncbi:MAG: TRAP transporter small permease [Hyphomicrobiales bacterium]|nr:TRAP transporter small permease [Hyphomicrobiales bacterium]MDE2114183.1 TRAP transporter small permease [Hyphomicrobiales bacterium]
MAGATLLIFVSVVQRYSTDLAISLSKWAAAHHIMALATGAKAVFTWLISIDLTWSQELCIFMFVWMAKFGAAYGVRTGVHVGVDLALNKLETRSKHKVVLFGLLAGAFFTFVVAAFGTRFVIHMWQTGETSNDLEAPMWFVYLAIPCGTSLMCFRFLQVAYTFSKTGELPHTDESHVEGLEEASLLPDVGAKP